ncbi:hypothetical protein [Streptomyces tritici]|uniref:hypothetical protein n=1 Tax=Streptomyces tritici TaxID=2054410 RepID=UPI003AEF9278
MTTRRASLDEAAGLLRAARGTTAGLGAVDAWHAFLRFGARPFDLPDSDPDSPDPSDVDGLLFQYGTYSFGGPPAFILDFTRQFASVDGHGDHDHYVQVHCELRYAPVPALTALGSFHSWFFPAPGAGLRAWADGLTARAAWRTIAAIEPAGIEVFQERV